MASVATDDAGLLTAWRQGDRRAGAELLRRHGHAVARFFERRVADTHIDDLVQRTFEGCHRSRDLVPEGVRFAAYLLGIARKQLLMFIRDARPERRCDASVGGLAARSSMGPSRVAAELEQRRLLQRAVRRLSEPQRTAIELFYWEELSVPEIAVAMGAPEGTVKTRLAAARRRLRSLVVQLAETPQLAETTSSLLGEGPHRA